MRTRFYLRNRRKEKHLPHMLSFQVWKKSMNLRYMIEAGIYGGILLLYQYEISAFNKDLHIAMREIVEFEILNKEIVDHGGRTYAESHAGSTTAAYYASHRLLADENEDGLPPVEDYLGSL